MSSEYFFFYTEASIVCIILFGMLLVHDIWTRDRSESQIKYDHTLIAHILYFISDNLWAATISDRLPRTRFVVAILNYSNAVLLALIAYEWFHFAVATARLPFGNTARGRRIIGAPMLFTVVVFVAAYIIDPAYWVSARGELNPMYYPLFLFSPLVYVVSASVISIREARRPENAERRRIYIMIGIYPPMLVIFGVIQLVLLNAPMFCFGCAIMMLAFFIQAMDENISIDALTRLNNRGQLNRYLRQEAGRRRENLTTCAMMIDVDDFKRINDTYGHAAGDRALMMVADALKSVADTLVPAPFLCRYGGDEFAMIVHVEQPADVAQVNARIHEALAVRVGAAHMPYALTLSIGCDAFRGDGDTLQECLHRADERLYIEKKRAGKGR